MIKVGYYEYDSDWDSAITYEKVEFVFDNIELAEEYIEKIQQFFEKIDAISHKLETEIEKRIQEDLNVASSLLSTTNIYDSVKDVLRNGLLVRYHNKEFFKTILTENEFNTLYIKQRNEEHRKLQILGEVVHNPEFV